MDDNLIKGTKNEAQLILKTEGDSITELSKELENVVLNKNNNNKNKS